LLSVGGVVFVSWEIAKDNPGLLAALYVAFHMALLYPLYIGLRQGLRSSMPPAAKDPNADGLIPIAR
jgi:hypothetical protein